MSGPILHDWSEIQYLWADRTKELLSRDLVSARHHSDIGGENADTPKL